MFQFRSSLFVGLLMFINTGVLYANTLTMATNTSTDNSGLLTYLFPHFTKQTNIDVDYVAVGTGVALKLGRESKVDVLLVHAPKAEQTYMEQNFGIRRELFMFNDFVIVGKDDEPFADLGTLFQHVINNKKTFVSRGDNSGTHKKEASLWLVHNYDPIGEPWYFETGYGIAKTLQEANVRDAYTLIDRGTWYAKESEVDLNIVFEHAPQLLNPYSAIIVNNRPDNLALANQFVDWLLTPETQQLIADYRINNKVLFRPLAQYNP